MRFSLTPYPTGPASPIEVIEVEMERKGSLLWLRFFTEGDVNAVAWPDPHPHERTDELWKHTCFEVFVTAGEGYVEYNLSPSHQWASYSFDSYRKGMRPAELRATVLGLDGGEDYLALEATIELPENADRLALSAVIENLSDEKTYWALAHPSDKPDFHHSGSFTLVLPPAEPA